MNDLISKLTAVRPDERQIKWQELGFTAFFHFGVNTFTNVEWGSGKEDPKVFDPKKLDTDQWCKAVKNAGIKACILTVKHHDGFCLWDTIYTDHSVMASKKPVDVAGLFVDSCRRYGLKPGFYLSPWDMHEPTYGSGKAYDDFFCGQLEELTTGFGELYTLWFDGACGEGPNGRVQEYDWERYFEIIRKNQRQAVISIMGPDVRWIGNEAGITRKSEWSVVSTRLQNRDTIAAASQQSDEIKPLSPMDEDLGSQSALKNENELCWYPAEVDVSIRPGWFYHPEEDDKVRSVDDLLHIYESSVGGNAVLLLNIPPDTDGWINKHDEKRLKELGETIKEIYKTNLCVSATVRVVEDAPNTAAPTAPNNENRQTISKILKDDDDYWCSDTETATIQIDFPQKQTIRRLVLNEQIRQSQRIEAFEVYAKNETDYQHIYSGTTVGFKKICAFKAVTTESLKIKIINTREHPTLRHIAAY